MACLKRRKTGMCTHHQCEFQSETEHGYDCVQVFTESDCKLVGLGTEFINKCEVGEDCLEKCSYSFKTIRQLV